MNSKTKGTVGLILTSIVALALLASGTAKLIGVEMMTQILGDKTMFVGLIEIVCVALFLYPKTNNLGFFLLCSYLGGVIATEWIHLSGMPLPGVILNTVLWIGMYLRKPQLFGF